MKTLRKQIVIALALIGMGSTAIAVQAQTAPMEGRHANAMSQEQRAAKMSEHYAARQAKLHDALQLSGGQESAWAAYQAAIKPDGRMMGQMGDRASWKSMSAPQRLEKMIAMSEQHTAKMKATLPAVNTFYSVLNPAQKKVFDEQSMGGGHGRGGHGAHAGAGNWGKK
jgi:protein CpxP